MTRGYQILLTYLHVKLLIVGREVDVAEHGPCLLSYQLPRD